MFENRIERGFYNFWDVIEIYNRDNSLPLDFYQNLFSGIAIAEGADAEGNKSSYLSN